ncbi:MAG: MFS transporter, partial [Caldilineaceae bacterium]|nr:MFS transporter [Caldilineaceae bacterium]
HHFGWNLFLNSVDVIFFMGAISLISATTILPLFISKLTASTIPLALVAMLSQGGHFLPQLFVANYVERLDRKKPIIVNLGFLAERLPAILFVLAPLAALYSPLLALVLFLLLYSWFNLGGGFVATAWQELIARCFPVTRRGRFFGVNSFIGTLLGIAAASLAGEFLAVVPFPFNFAYIFGAAGFCILISWFFLAQTREPVEAANGTARSLRAYLAALPAVLHADANFRSFLIARVTLAMSEMGTGFLTVAAIATWGISDSTVATFTTATLIGQTTGNLGGGFFSDHFGHRLALEISALLALLAFGLAWFAPTPLWFIAVFFFMGLFRGMRMVSSMLVILEFCPPEKRPTYLGLANTLTGIGSMVAPLVGAGLVWVSYSWVFAASTVASLAALLMLRFWVSDPRFVIATR